MRRIETEESREKRKKRNSMIMGIVMLVILISGTAGFAFPLPFSLFNIGDYKVLYTTGFAQ